MILTSPNIALTAVCPTCGAEVTLNKHAARYASRGVMCETCRRKGVGWVGKEAYKEYLKTAHWQAFRLKALRRAGHKCQVCAKTNGLEVHHNDYSRLGAELMTDVVVLCEGCHGLFHGEL